MNLILKTFFSAILGVVLGLPLACIDQNAFATTKPAKTAAPEKNKAPAAEETSQELPNLAQQIATIKEDMNKLSDTIIKEVGENTDDLQKNLQASVSKIHQHMDTVRPAVEKLAEATQRQKEVLAPTIAEIKEQAKAIRDRMDSEEWRATARRISEQTKTELNKLSEELEELRYELNQQKIEPSPQKVPQDHDKLRP